MNPKQRKVRRSGRGPIAGFTTVEYVLALEKVVAVARELVAVEPVDTGYPGRQLAVKLALDELAKVVEKG